MVEIKYAINIIFYDGVEVSQIPFLLRLHREEVDQLIAARETFINRLDHYVRMQGNHLLLYNELKDMHNTGHWIFAGELQDLLYDLEVNIDYKIPTIFSELLYYTCKQLKGDDLWKHVAWTKDDKSMGLRWFMAKVITSMEYKL